jgi:hypothetical protein
LSLWSCSDNRFNFRQFKETQSIIQLATEAGLPTLDEAQRLVIEEIKQAKGAGALGPKVIHGYGSSGKGVQKKGSLIGYTSSTMPYGSK